ncbi:glycosyl hydrolase, family 13 [Agrilactobacillus composti DSM 18527 = JCM 14202]|uniref:Glycosyl hydrolase, family 13 n=1 Tax=Agrilactobacillus composti DSM 18527 = JCM 14202 TaxID=1423734 RepID=X0QNF5_9LACO|nr:glycoside hydrolase family 13 protein [Agrilactobacillus composti]KRM32548.1 glycosyl hydrolase, family 13 [Agrilactobacillus composti DSM 18527 = JCM 14202]GAF40145.1 neopullulanase [Agrilactobacillus composti DSM 18527 = JCM 14202]
MKKDALYHRTESEYAFLYKPKEFVVRMRTAKADVAQVTLYYGDPFDNRPRKNGAIGWHYRRIRMNKGLETQNHQYWEIKLRPQFTRIQYAFHVTGLDGSQTYYGELGCVDFNGGEIQNMANYFRLPYFHQIDMAKSPQWVKQTVWYQIFPERFANGDKSLDRPGTLPWDTEAHPGRQDYYGGDLQGIIDHLDYLQALGINGLYLTPIFKAASNHKYDTIDYLEIDPDFGDKQTFKKLVDEAHARGMRVMLDAVFNHIGDESVQWQDVLRHQEKSRFKDWFHIRKFPVSYEATADFEVARKLNYATFAFTPHMPKLNTANPEVQDYLLTVAKYWIEQFDIDAWRLDVADEVDHHFWRAFSEACHQLKPDFYILGEVWHNSEPWLDGSEFTGVMNYQFTGLINRKFLYHNINNHSFTEGLNQQLMSYRAQTSEMMFNVLDSHDTPRVLTLANGDKDAVKSAMAFTFLQKGVPCIFYGDEISLVGNQDPDNRRPMCWDETKQDGEMLAFMKALIAVRRQYANFLSEAPMVWVDPENEQMLTLIREGRTIEFVCLFNTSDTKQTIALKNGDQEIFSRRLDDIDGTAQLLPEGFVVLKRWKK